jgi:hypothetical protein
MSSNSRPIDIPSDSDVEDAMSSTTPILAPVHPAPLLPSLAPSEDTEAFYEDEVAPTPQLSPSAPPLVTRTPTESSSHTTPVPAYTTLMFPRRKTIIGARKSVCRATTIIRTPTHPTLPSSPAIPTIIPTSTSCLPLKKRARFTAPVLPFTETTYTPPPTQFHIGESSRAAAARGPTAPTLEAQLSAQQEQMDRLGYRVDEILTTRLEVVEEDVEGLTLGRVGIDVSYQGLEARQKEMKTR